MKPEADLASSETAHTVRRIEPADVPALFEVRVATDENRLTLEQLNSLGITPETVEDMLLGSSKGWLAEADGKVVGFAMGNRSTGEMWVIAVLPSHIQRGIGGELLERVEAWLFAEGWKEIWLTTDVDRTLRAYSFYRNRGWEDWKSERGNLYMKKSRGFHLETPSLILRPFRLTDTRRVLEMSQEECARRWLPSQVYKDERHATEVVEYLIAQFNLETSPTTNVFVFGVEEKLTGRLIGHAGLCPLFSDVEVGFGIATSEQRKGYATEAVSRVCAWGLERFSLPAILGVTDAENVASQGVLTRCGFSRKEEKRMCLQGVDRPVVIFEIRNGRIS